MPPKTTTTSSSRTAGVPIWRQNQRPQVPQRNAIAPGTHLFSRGNSSNPSSRNNSPRPSLQHQTNQNLPSSSARRRNFNNNLNNSSTNNANFGRHSTTIYTTKDLEEKNAEFLALREKRINQTLPLVRQRQNELLDICTATADIVHSKQLEYTEMEKKDQTVLENELQTLADVRRSIEEKKKQVEDAKQRKREADEKLVAATQRHKDIQAESDVVAQEISAIDAEIKQVCQRKEESNIATKEKLREKEEQKKGVDDLRQNYDQALDEKKNADRIYEEKLEVLDDLKKKIANLKAERARLFSGGRK